MRILAIRGCNLASLAGEFEIDLAHGPLGVAGVFAIVGPTGAGKSTLLDAMCVALFDRTPRLPGHSRFTVGHGEEDPLTLGAQDPRTLLRRGASQGWAEVDFESGDSRRYRARWSVRRARGATHGNLQDQQISFVRIDADSVITERLGGTKTETLKAIHQKLGLTFDQFRRSALLAQGDFAAFLRAEGKDRSELLERMTGTEIYSKLSIAAHARAVAAEQMLKDRHGAALAITVLDDGARGTVEAELAGAFTARDAVRARHAAATELATWRTEATRREVALEGAAAELAQAEADAGDAAPLRDHLVLVRRAEALRPTWDEATRLDRQHTVSEGEREIAEEAATTATASQRELATTRGRIVELHAPIRAARIAAGIVELEAPSRAVFAPSSGEVMEQRASTSGTTSGTGHRTSRPASALFGLSDRVEAAERRAHAALKAATWLVDRRALRGELATWPELATKLAQARTLGDGIAAADRVLEAQAIERAQLAQKHLAAGIAFETAKLKLADATRELDGYVKRRTIAPEAAGRAEDTARAVCGDLERLVATSAGAREAANIVREHELRLKELELAAVIDRDREQVVGHERATAELLRGERARVVHELRKAAGYEHARAELVAGEPCPLCGADEHPWKDRGAFDTLIADAERAHGEADTAWSTATATLAQLAARATHRDAERTRFASTGATAAAAAERHAADWRAQLGSLGELILVTDPATPEAEHLALERLEAARGRLEAARAQRSAALAVEKAIGEAQARREVCLADVAHHDADLRAIDGDLATLDSVVERITAERDAKVDRHAELSRDLVAAAGRWAAALPAPDRASFGASGATDVVAMVEDVATLPVRAAKRTRRKAGDPDAPRGTTIGSNASGGDAPRGTSSSGDERESAAPRGTTIGSSASGAEAPHGTSIGSSASGNDAPRGTSSGAVERESDAPRGTSVGSSASGADAPRGTTIGSTVGGTHAPRGTSIGSSASGNDAPRGTSSGAVERESDAPRGTTIGSSASGGDAPRGTSNGSIGASGRESDAPRGTSIGLVGSTPVGFTIPDHAVFERVVEAWRERASIVAQAEAALAGVLGELDRATLEVERAVADTGARRAEADKRLRELAGELAVARATLDAARIGAGFDQIELERLLAGEPGRAEAIVAQLETLDRAIDRAKTRLAERRRHVGDHQAVRPSGSDELDADADRVGELAVEMAAAADHAAKLQATLAADEDARQRRDHALSQFAAAERAAEVDRVLGQVIGSHDGKLFRSFAQSLTLDQLLAVANAHLEELAPRYQLERVPKHDLELQVIDRDFGGEVRSVQSLSGGESFLVSLALALGLSSMSAHDVRVRTLLIDEGFGTLDPATLDSALAVLDELQATGRQVGVISHVPALLDRVRAHVRVTPRGGGRSDVHVPPS